MRARGVALALTLAGAALASPPARAADREACFSAAESAQKLRTQGRLRAAREKLLVCAQTGCPSAVQSDCSTWLSEVSGEVPSIVVEAHDTHGNDVADVRVLVDGTTVADRLDGRPIELESGLPRTATRARRISPRGSLAVARGKREGARRRGADVAGGSRGCGELTLVLEERTDARPDPGGRRRSRARQHGGLLGVGPGGLLESAEQLLAGVQSVERQRGTHQARRGRCVARRGGGGDRCRCMAVPDAETRDGRGTAFAERGGAGAAAAGGRNRGCRWSVLKLRARSAVTCHPSVRLEPW